MVGKTHVMLWRNGHVLFNGCQGLLKRPSKECSSFFSYCALWRLRAFSTLLVYFTAFSLFFIFFFRKSVVCGMRIFFLFNVLIVDVKSFEYYVTCHHGQLKILFCSKCKNVVLNNFVTGSQRKYHLDFLIGVSGSLTSFFSIVKYYIIGLKVVAQQTSLFLKV